MKTNDKVSMSPKDYLDQCENTLAEKHHRRLQKITRESLQSDQKKWHTPWLKPALASAFSVFLILNIVSYNKNDKTNNKTIALDSSLPSWVTDTDVPLTLIENLDFYDWLAKQKNDRNAKKKALTLVAFNELREHYPGKRFATSDLAERFPRATANIGAIRR